MAPLKTFVSAMCLAGLCAASGLAQSPVSGIAPAGVDVTGVWHLGRVTGDLERIIAFYHDLLGLGLRGARDQARRFAANKVNNDFVNAPPNAEFRAAFMPIQGTSAATDPQSQIYLEAFEYRNIDRRQMIPALFNPGVNSLRFLVRDLDKTLAAAKSAGVAIITAGGEAVAVPTPAGLTGSTKSIMLRDPDGYPVELAEVTPTPRTFAPEGSNILGAHMSVVVADLDASLTFYRRFVGADLRTSEPGAWQRSTALSRLRAIPEADFRSVAVSLPGSAVVLELLQFRGLEQTPYRPVFQDIGFGHVAFLARDIRLVLDRMNQLGIKALSQSGTWTEFNPSLRGIYTRDHDGFFLEIIERR